MVNRLGAVAVVGVTHVVAELYELVGGLVGARYAAGRRCPHQRTAASRKRPQVPCFGVLGDVDTEVHAFFTFGRRRRTRETRVAVLSGRRRAN